MAIHPKKMTKYQRVRAGLMTDAFRKIEHDLHWRLFQIGSIPKDWHEIEIENPPEHPRQGKITVRIDDDVLKYFRGLGRGYQKRMNLVLRSYMLGRLAQIVQGPDTTDWILHPERLPDLPEPVDWGGSLSNVEKALLQANQPDAVQAGAKASRANGRVVRKGGRVRGAPR